MVFLNVANLNVKREGLHILQDTSLYVEKGEIVVVAGTNGAGKSTLLRTISGLHKAESGQIYFRDMCCTNLPSYEMVAKGICMIPEGRQLFPKLTVKENLLIGAYRHRQDKQRVKQSLVRVYKLFPVLKQYENRAAAAFSGGEQQMISIGRGLMSEPDLLLIDEMSLGLAPQVLKRLFEVLQQLNRSGISILLVEQNAGQALGIAHRAYVLENGKITLEGTGRELWEHPQVKKSYLGI